MSSVSRSRVAAVAAGSIIIVGLGSFGAVAGGLIGSADIRDGGVKKVDIGRGTVGHGEIIDGSVNETQLSDRVVEKLNSSSAPGPRGEKGDTGPAGADGAPGVSDYQAVSEREPVLDGTNVLNVTCPVGTAPLGGGADPDLGVSLEGDWPTPTGWAFRVSQFYVSPLPSVTMHAVCATVAPPAS